MKQQRTSRKTSINRWLRIWLLRHVQVALSSLGRMSRSPIGTLMTTTVIGIAVSLPTGMWVMLDNVKQLSGSWEGSATVSVFLKNDSTENQVVDFADQLRRRPEITEVQLITRDDAMVEFQQLSGFGKALEVLQENPLPPVLVVTPTQQYSEPALAEKLLNDLRQERLTDFAQLDLEWVRRFHAITEIAIRAVIVLGTVLSLAVLLIIGNTIRLEIQNRHDEIEITKLIGATDAFIRRPFLYIGFWYGLMGGLTAWLLVSISLWLLSGPIEQLTGLYQSEFSLDILGPVAAVMVLLGTALLGLTGARIAVGRHLSDIEPD